MRFHGVPVTLTTPDGYRFLGDAELFISGDTRTHVKWWEGTIRIYDALRAGYMGPESWRRLALRTGYIVHDEEGRLPDLTNAIVVQLDVQGKAERDKKSGKMVVERRTVEVHFVTEETSV